VTGSPRAAPGTYEEFQKQDGMVKVVMHP